MKTENWIIIAAIVAAIYFYKKNAQAKPASENKTVTTNKPVTVKPTPKTTPTPTPTTKPTPAPAAVIVKPAASDEEKPAQVISPVFIPEIKPTVFDQVKIDKIQAEAPATITTAIEVLKPVDEKPTNIFEEILEVIIKPISPRKVVNPTVKVISAPSTKTTTVRNTNFQITRNFWKK